MVEEWRKELAEKIDGGFAETPAPRKEGFTTDWRFVTKGIKGKHWSELEPEVLFSHRNDLLFFEPEQLRYYLPAFLRWAVLNPDEIDTLPYTLNSLFIPPDPDDGKRGEKELRELIKEYPEEAQAMMEQRFERFKTQDDETERFAWEVWRGGSSNELTASLVEKRRPLRHSMGPIGILNHTAYTLTKNLRGNR